MTVNHISAAERKSAFCGGYEYRWRDPQAWFGNTQGWTPIDDWVDAGMLAAGDDLRAGRPRAPEAAWERWRDADDAVGAPLAPPGALSAGRGG